MVEQMMKKMDLTTSPKYWDMYHGVGFCKLWDLSLGYCDEGGLEHSHKIYNMLRREYLNQRGIKKS